MWGASFLMRKKPSRVSADQLEIHSSWIAGKRIASWDKLWSRILRDVAPDVREEPQNSQAADADDRSV